VGDDQALDSLIPTIEIQGFTRLSFTPADAMYGEVKVRQKGETLALKEGRRNQFRGAINGALTERLPLTPTPGGGGVSDMGGESDRCLSSVALEGRLGQAYNEQAFRYFLAIERKRSERSGHPFLLLLVDLKEQEGASASFDSMVANNLFSNLRLCLRETDFVGWYREERVAGAVLIELGDRRPTEVSRLIGQRVSERLYERLPSGVARRLQVCIYQHPELDWIDSGDGFHSVLYPEVTRRSLFHRCALAVKRTIALAVAAVALLLDPFMHGLN